MNEQLFKAVELDTIENVIHALENERINAASYYGAKSIILATNNGNHEILKVLLENGKKIPRASFWSNNYNIAKTTLLSATRNGRSDLLRLLLDYQANVVKSDLKEAFIEALLSGNIEALKLLLDAGVNVNFKDKRGITPLMYAILFPNENQETLVEWLLAAGAHVNVKLESFIQEGKRLKREVNTALSYAEKSENLKLVSILKNGKKYRQTIKIQQTIKLKTKLINYF